MKYCRGCNQTKSYLEFHVKKSKKDGLASKCKPCALDIIYANRDANREHYNELQRASLAANPERRNQRYERRKDKHAAYRRENSTRHNAAQRAWRLKNPGKASGYVKTWFEKDPVGRGEIRRLNNQRRRARQAAATIVPFTREQLASRWDYYGGMCWMKCGAVATQTDHVKPLSKGGAHALCNLRPICGPCNFSKQATWPLALAD